MNEKTHYCKDVIVSFLIPAGWNISSALSSFPNGSGNEASNNAAIWNTADTESEWKSFVEIGRKHSRTFTGGGEGTVFLELISDENASYLRIFHYWFRLALNLKTEYLLLG